MTKFPDGSIEVRFSFSSKNNYSTLDVRLYDLTQFCHSVRRQYSRWLFDGRPITERFFGFLVFFPGRFHHHRAHRTTFGIYERRARDKSARLSVWAQFYAPLNFFSSNFCAFTFFLFGLSLLLLLLFLSHRVPSAADVGCGRIHARHRHHFSVGTPAATHRIVYTQRGYTGD